jgi:transcriptional regulator with XRE-family HTH domain
VTRGQTFAAVIRQRRRQLDLTQQEVARKVGTSIGYITLLESGQRHPSEKVVTKLAAVLGLDQRELFFRANPSTEFLISQPENSGNLPVWDAFCRDEALHKLYDISEQEMRALSQVALMGEVRSPRDFVFILNTIRHALSK